MNEVFDRIGIEVTLPTPDAFLKVMETLTRIGIASNQKKTLYQTCHILHKKGRYKLVHFKELFQLDGLPSNITEDDVKRRNSIARLLVQWGLLSFVDEVWNQAPSLPVNYMKILPYKEKGDWTLESKYTVGRKG